MKLYWLLILLLVIPLATAQVESFGTFKQNQQVNLIQTWNGTKCNVTSITAPDSTLIITGRLMTKNGLKFNLTLIDSQVFRIGEYNVCGDCDSSPWCANFNITPSGYTSTLGFFILFLVFIVLIFVMGMSLKNNWIMMLGSILVLILGFFVIVNGVDVIKDTNTTWAIGIILWALGIYFIFLSVEEVKKEVKESISYVGEVITGTAPSVFYNEQPITIEEALSLILNKITKIEKSVA
jgi:hypothetical protein